VDVKLHNLIGNAIRGVADLNRDRDSVVPSDLGLVQGEIRVLETAVAQAVTEREQRRTRLIPVTSPLVGRLM
jgi:hypothetical protein